ncbi:hypothetical protein BFC17_13110 [Alteromonas lipolytica]|uniref:Uncharacterized protein n=1 Tax=Alteromonas lipolytica TaxID=1856405 RepID=A0A1E8FJS2_9ALTE|nr:hypothetical protein BFC17_13110 [Alteromonas lipolytica]
MFLPDIDDENAVSYQVAKTEYKPRLLGYSSYIKTKSTKNAPSCTGKEQFHNCHKISIFVFDNVDNC